MPPLLPLPPGSARYFIVEQDVVVYVVQDGGCTKRVTHTHRGLRVIDKGSGNVGTLADWSVEVN